VNTRSRRRDVFIFGLVIVILAVTTYLDPPYA